MGYFICVLHKIWGKKSKDIRRVISHSEEGRKYSGWPERWLCPSWNGRGGLEEERRTVNSGSPRALTLQKDWKTERDRKTERQKGDFVQVETGEEDVISRDEYIWEILNSPEPSSVKFPLDLIIIVYKVPFENIVHLINSSTINNEHKWALRNND